MKPLKKPLKPLSAMMLLIGVTGTSIISVKVYQTTQGVAVDAQEYASVVRNDVAAVFKAQIPALKNTPFEFDVFNGARTTACGKSDTSTGPFYCAGDNHIALPIEFFNNMCVSYGACDVKKSREYVITWVIAHEIAHAAQQSLGLMDARTRAWQEIGQPRFNAESVKTELQADCLAGVYIGIMSKNNPQARADISRASFALGDVGDTAQFTHGSGVDRTAAVTRGFDAMNVNICLKGEKL
jgi:predicted metalloprotease